MSFERAWLVVVLLGVACAPDAPAWLTGQVTFEGEDDHSGVIVSVIGPSEAGAVSDGDGRFTLRHLRAGTYSVVLAAADSIEGQRVRTVVLTDTGVELEATVFHPAGRATGTVVDAATGQPLGGALVVSARSRAAAISSPTGAFSLGGLGLGDATVILSASGYTPVEKAVHTESRLTPVELGAVALVTGEATVRRPSLKGRVVFADLTPAPATRVRLTKAPGFDQETQSDANGDFHFDQVAAGLVTLTFNKGSFEATLPNVLALAGTSGLIVDQGLTPLEKGPVTLTYGRLVTAMTSVQLTPNHRTFLGTTYDQGGYNVRAIALDGGATFDLFDPGELGASRPAVVAIGADSTTVAIEARDPFGISDAYPVLLASTTSRGRQLVTSYGCSIRTEADSIYVIAGGACRYGGDLVRVPLRFGAQPVSLGRFNSVTFDLPHQRLFDVSPNDSTFTTYSLDLIDLTVEPVARRRLATHANGVITISPSGEYVVYYESQTNGYAYWVVSVTTGVVHELRRNTSLLNLQFLDDLHLVFSAYNAGITVVTLPSGAEFTFGSQGEDALLPTGGGLFAVCGVRDDSGTGSLSLVPPTGTPRTQITRTAWWARWSLDGQRLYFIDSVDLGSRRGRFAYVTRTSATPVVIDTKIATDVYYPGFSTEDEMAVYVRRQDDGTSLLATFNTGLGRVTLMDSLDRSNLASWSWTFSPGARWLVFAGLKSAPAAQIVRSTSGGPETPVVGTGSLMWIDSHSAFVIRSDRQPWSALGGTYHAVFE